ncbi:MAG: DUF72 domain-containing protein [Alphaproteobacteria bacterium]
MPRHRVGTSGWSYDGWRGLFFPETLKRTDWLSYYAESFASVEINASFYRLPRQSMLEGWVTRTPPGFLFAVKVWRVITHFRRLVDCAEPLAAFLDRLSGLGEKLGPVLFQLPPKFAADFERLAGFLALLPEDRRFTFEFRDPSWHCEETYKLLAAHGAAFCPFELGGVTAPRVATADFVYVRLHGRTGRYRGNYSEAALADWAGWLGERIAEGRDVYVYFDNTDEADYALRNARRLGEMLSVE